MKRIMAWMLIMIFVLSASVTAFAAESNPGGENRQTDIGVYARYTDYTQWNTVPVDEHGQGTTVLPDGTEITVSGALKPGCQFVIDPIPEQEALDWISDVLGGKAKDLSPFHIFFIDGNGNTRTADDVTVTVKLPEKLTDPVAYSLTSEGKTSGLTVTAKDGFLTFPTDGSPYYVLGETVSGSTNPPASYTITVTADGADVFCNGQSGKQFTIDRLSEPTLLIRSVSGKEITQVLLNGEDVTNQVKGGYYTLEPIYENKVLTVVTKDATPAQGKTYTVQGTIKRDGQPVKDITIELRSILKTDVTDKDGEFSFSNVECGKHSLTAIENGKIIGYTELVLAEGNETNHSLSDGIYTVTANQNEIGINLTLNLTDDDTMSIASVTDVQASGNPGGGNQGDTNQGDTNSPQTGDNTNLLLWLVLMLIAFAGFVAAFAYSRKRKTGK